MSHKIENTSPKTQLIEKWKSVKNDAFRLSEIKDSNKLWTTVQLLENQHQQLDEDLNVTSQVANYDPVIMKMVRRITPQLIAYDIVGVQPMATPTAVGFAIRARYPDTSNPVDYTKGKEALFDTIDTAHSGTGTHDQTVNPFLAATDVASKTGKPLATAVGERAEWKSMGFSIDKVTLEAKTRQLRADYSLEIEKDMRSVHGLDAATELANILTDEITLETNQELVRTLYHCAMIGAQGTTTAGTYDYVADSDGRWGGERALSLYTFIEREANRLAFKNRRGRGNFIITSADVATVLAFAGLLKNDTHYTQNMDVDLVGSTFAGTAGRFKVFIDPMLEHNGVLVGYKGNTQYDAGVLYAPYVPLSAHSGVDVTNGFSKAIGFKSRYDIVANPYTTLEQGKNVYYSKFAIANM